ncbi:MAG TPA: FtsX-like permease family protein [Terracidiphilus sp.]|jgi:putative ABC transport system permease protein|nr:FtsX-like permease family protein [Terracidiphilus sp.]
MRSQLSFAGFAWKNLWRRRLRTLLTLFGIGMAIGAFVALVGFSRSFEHEWQRLYSSSGTDIAVVDKNFMNSSVNQALQGKLRAVPVVAQADPMIFNILDITPDVNAIVFGWLDDSYEFDSLTFSSGGRFHNGKPEIIVGELLAKNLNKKVGDTVELQGGTFTIVGVFHGGTALEVGALIMPIDQLQQISSLQGKVSGFHVRLKPAPAGESPEHYMKRAQKEIEAALPGLNAQGAADRAANNQFVTLAHAVAWGTSCIALLMGILGIANTMAMSVFERTREIGILRAIGWKAWRVLLLIQVEATVLGFVGGILGILIGWGALHLLSTLPQTASVVSASFSPLHFVEALGISLLSGLVAGAYPAWRGAHLSPVEALRHD